MDVFRSARIAAALGIATMMFAGIEPALAFDHEVKKVSLVEQGLKRTCEDGPPTQAAVHGVVDTYYARSSASDEYRGLGQPFNDDLVGNLFSQIVQLIGKWISDSIDGWIADAVQLGVSWLRGLVLSPLCLLSDIPWSKVLVGAMVILSVVRLVKPSIDQNVPKALFAIAHALLSVQLSYVCTLLLLGNNIATLDSAWASAIRGGILFGIGGLASVLAPLLGGAIAGGIGFTIGEVLAFTGLVVFMLIGLATILLLVKTIALRLVHVTLYLADPINQVLLPEPTSDNTHLLRNYGRCLWLEFCWFALLAFIVEIMFCDLNLWLKVLFGLAGLFHCSRISEQQVDLGRERLGLPRRVWPLFVSHRRRSLEKHL